jgi:hypothetical protein
MGSIWAVQPLFNASSVPLDQTPGTLPNMADTVAGWFQLCYFEQVVKTIVNFQVVETTTPLQFQGVITPASPRQLAMRPEGQRKWKWLDVHAWPTLQLSPDDVVVYQGLQYRVWSKLDFTQYGYVKYSLVNDYTGSGPAGGV